MLPAAGHVLVSIVDPALLGEAAARASLRPDEEEVAARVRFEKDARHWRACRAALRQILGEALGIAPVELALVNGEFGKPALEAPHHRLHFNLSHCEDLALVALSLDGPVGVDIEPAGRAASLLGCEATFCHADEIAELPGEEGRRAAALLEIWTRKEALLKALGTGMSLAPETVSLAAAEPHPRLRSFRVQALDHPLLTRHAARLAVLREISRVSFDVFQA